MMDINNYVLFLNLGILNICGFYIKNYILLFLIVVFYDLKKNDFYCFL